MGLDMVELVMDCEEQFGIHLTDEACQRIRTVQDLADTIARLRGDSGWRSECATMRMFHRIRRSLVRAGAARRDVRLDATFEALLPRSRREAAVRELKREQLRDLIAFRDGHLDPNLWFAAAATMAVFVGCLVGSGVAGAAYGFVAAGALAIIGGVLIPVRAWRVARTVPVDAGCATVRDAVLRLAPRAPTYSLASDALMLRVRKMVSEQTGFDVDVVRPESRFAEDLEC